MVAFATIKVSIFNFFSMLMRQRKVRRTVAAIVFFLLLTMLISVDLVPHQVGLKVGEVSSVDIFAPRSVVFVDQMKTEEMRREAALAVRNQYDRDYQVSQAIQRDISSVIEGIRGVQNDLGLSRQSRIDRLREMLPFSLPEETLAVLAQPAPRALEQVEREVNGLVAQAMDSQEGVTSENLQETRKNLADRIKQLHFTQSYEKLALALVQSYLRPNKFFNAEKTRLLREAAMDSVSPQQVTVRQGEKIVGAGDVVSVEQMAKLQALGLTRSEVPWRIIIGSALLVALLMTVVLFYLYQQNKEIYQQAGRLYLLGIIILVVLGLAKVIVSINVTQWPELGALFGYMVPVAAAGMLIAILLDSRLAVLVVTIISFLLMLMTKNQVNFGIVGLVSGITGVYSVSRLSQRGDLARAGLYTSLASILSIIIMGLLNSASAGLVITSSTFLGLINGLLSSVLTIGLLPYLETAFGITSSVRLLELSHPSNPLLKRLLTEAPGTYHHSIIVGNLAEAAAEAVNAESLLVRVGAYYHDIGKIKRPYFFIENQFTADNPHDKIAPTLSTLILISHVKDGVELARENKLPQVIIDIIEQHHGSGLCTYFYHKAIDNGQNEGINEDEFRYEGPKPQTREAALVMLADSVEAAVRSLQNRSHGRVEGMVRKIIKDKLMDGQLDECDLTFKDLDVVATTFMQVLSGIFHSRIEYPDMAKEIERRKTKRVGLRKQPPGRSARG